MEKLDDLIKEALEGEDKELFERTSEQGYFALAMGIFTGKRAWVNWVVMIVQSVLFLVGIWCAVGLFQATDLLIGLKWGLSSLFFLLSSVILKLSLIPVMQADRVMLELKRIELLLASNTQ